jgi:DNA-binding LacI/PurR family transcriptional regulator
MRVPQRRSLVADAADALREALRRGDLGAPLPGERVLAARLHVSRDTVRLALRSLQREGWTEPPRPGRRRGMLQRSRRSRRAHGRRLALLSPMRLEEMQPQALLEVDAIRTHLAENGWSLDVATPRLFHLADPSATLQRLVADARADAWVLYQCHEPIQLWFQETRQPALIWGSPLRGVDLPFVDTDWEAAAFHAGGLLRRAGHATVGLIVPQVRLAGTEAAEQGLGKSIGRVVPVRDAGRRDALLRSLAAAFEAPRPPTALVATRPRQALTVISWAAGLGRRIPVDLSLVSLADEGWFADVAPDVSRYRTHLGRLTRTLLRKIAEIGSAHGVARSSQRLMPEFVSGRSVAAPRGA